ncbi:MAG: peptidylprolyl isomerase [Bacteroidales bacterium]|nr:peptidylprolyl isomerase [Bacteroidales bacterium]
MKTVRSLLLLVILTPSLLFAQGWKNKTLVQIGDKAISAKEFMEVYEKNNVNSEVIDKKSVDEYLDMYTIFKLKVLEAENLKMDTMPKFIKEYKNYRQQLAKPYFSNDAATEMLVEEAYDRMQYDVNASHILIKCDPHAVPADTIKAYNKALEARNRILKGEDFGDVAVELSDDPSARDIAAIPGKQRAYKGNRGTLGYFTAFDMVYPFESAVYNAKIDEVSMPVRTDFGYHIIKLNSKTPACGTIRAAHIFLHIDETDPMKSDSALREKAFNIYKELDKDGKNWESMVKKYSDDKGSAQHGGQLNPFRVSQIVPEFITAIKQLKENEISEPVRTNYGYHIIRLIGESGVRSFEEEKDNITKRVEKDMRAKVSDEQVLRRLKKDNKFKEYTKVKDAFIATIDTTLQEGKYVVAEGVDTNKTLFKFGKQQYKIADFIEYIEEHQQAQPFMSAGSYAYQLYDEFLKDSAFAYEDAHLEEKHPDFKLLVQEYHDGILLFDLMDKQVWKKAELDTAGIKQYYDNHKDEYMWGKRVKTILITVNNDESLARAEELINKDIPVDSIKAIVKAEGLKGIKVRSPFFQQGDDVDIDETEWKAGTIRVIPSTVDKTTKLVKILEVREPEPKTYKETRGVIISAYQAKLEEDWVKELKAKYPVTINEKVLNKVKKSYK